MPVISWPQTLINRVAAGRWVLFIGSGVSATSSNDGGGHPPSWSGLLQALADLIPDNAQREIGHELIAGRDLLSAADHIRYALAEAGDLATYQQMIRQFVEGPADDRFKPSDLHVALLDLDPKIVFTTNYDKLFDLAAMGGYRIHSVRSHNVANDLRLGEPVLVRLHGSTDAMDEVVLTRTDYAEVTRSGQDVFDALRALSLTSTILFVGYSLEDPDIQLVLQEIGRPGPSPEAHFLLAPEPSSASRVQVFKESFGVSVLTHRAGHYEDVLLTIRELGQEVEARRTLPPPP